MTTVTSKNAPTARRVRPNGTARFLVKGMITVSILFLMSAIAAYCGLLT